MNNNTTFTRGLLAPAKSARRIIFVLLSLLLVFVLSLSSVGCAPSEQYTPYVMDPELDLSAPVDKTPNASPSDLIEDALNTNAPPEDTTAATTDTTTAATTTTTQTTEATTTEATTAALDRDGYYYSKDDVALYIYTYGYLPDNFISKSQARKLGWEGGSLERYAKDCVIGGDRFGNYEGVLPKKKGRVYTECDIDTLGKSKRGAKRIVFSNDGLIYYTEDHYEHFELLYGNP